MHHSKGRATSHTELRSLMLDFTTKRMSSFTDAFEGGFGRSSYGSANNLGVLGLKHSSTGVNFLYDFVPTYPGGMVEDNSWGGADGEWAIVGTLAKGDLTQTAINLSGTSFASSTTIFEPSIETPTNAINTSLVSGTVCRIASTQIDPDSSEPNTWQDSPFSIGQPGFVDGVSGDPLVAAKVSVGDAIEFRATATSGPTTEGDIHRGIVTEVWPLAVAEPDRYGSIYVDFFGDNPPLDAVYNIWNIRVTDSISLTITQGQAIPFGQYDGGPWPSIISAGEMDAAKVSEGWFPNSRGLKFEDGINYWFFGDDGLVNDYFHMVLERPNGVFTHWWTGRAQSTDEVGIRNGSGVGAYMGTSGPTSGDEYQYIAALGPPTDQWKNPCFMSVDYTSDEDDESRIYMPGGGGDAYNPNPDVTTQLASNDQRVGVSVLDNENLDNLNFSAQIGLNGFRGKYAWKPANIYGGTATANTSFNGVAYPRNVMIPFSPCLAVLSYIPFDTVAQTRDTLNNNEHYYAAAIADYVHMGTYSGVYRGLCYAVSTGDVQPQEVSVGDKKFLSFPVTATSLTGTELFPLVPTSTSSGNAAYVYRKA